MSIHAHEEHNYYHPFFLILQVSSSYEKFFIARWLFGNELALLFLFQSKTPTCKLGSLATDEGQECKVVSMFFNPSFCGCINGKRRLQSCKSKPPSSVLSFIASRSSLELWFFSHILCLFVDPWACGVKLFQDLTMEDPRFHPCDLLLKILSSFLFRVLSCRGWYF